MMVVAAAHRAVAEDYLVEVHAMLAGVRSALEELAGIVVHPPSADAWRTTMATHPT
jgi:hypothetical protein